MRLFILTSAFLDVHIALAQIVATNLYSSLIPSKVLTTTKKLNNQFPRYTDSSAGVKKLFSADKWIFGFFPATLYALEKRKALCKATSANGLNAVDWDDLGRKTSTGLAPLTKSNNVGHDVGFLSFPHMHELAIDPNNATAANIVNGFSKYLVGRFNPTVGYTRSWHSSDPWDFVVIIDNMMNLNLLMVSAHLPKNSTLRDIATSHTDTTMKNHIRPDGSTWQYTTTTGAVTDKRTSQGYSDDSRGQAWAVYGFANIRLYNWTGDHNYLVTARRAATYFLKTLPSNEIVPWDFNAPVANRPADSSAATIVATGLLLLSQVETDTANKKKWSDAAIKIFNDITSLAWDPSWECLLANGTVNKPGNNYLTGTVYGDYYYIIAGNELISMGLAKCL
ncbi:glycoside hydrolase family 88 protein [Armillaria gallica]|uniref:Glycoside hydrolase family 88 protein n=1 Tax=Armillaria gallica TaxID=47427 RepID=A0A2H3CP24_ARMGA|nr:glycoside hydrolase family 88 protein [Armillaria gallica]